MREVEALLGLVVLAVVVAALANRLRTPAASLLVLVGLAVGFIPHLPSLHVSSTVLLVGVLPPLLFSAAQQMSMLDLRDVWRPVAGLATGLVIATALAVGYVSRLVDPQLGLPVALTLGAVLASTDPVAVAALSRELRLPARVATVVEAESLFNDATSLVLFEVVLGWAASRRPTLAGATLSFLRLGLGGAALGIAVGLLAGLALRRAREPSVQAASALLTPYVAAVVATALGVSPVTAVIVAGLMLGRRRTRVRAPAGRLVASSVYDVVVFLLENGVFALIGLDLAGFIRALPPGEGPLTVGLIAALIATLLLVRGTGLIAALLLPRLSKRAVAASGPAWRIGAAVTWAGTRGVVPLVAALSIPASTLSGRPFPDRALVLVVTAGAVVVTLTVQGATLAPLVRRLNVTASQQDLAAEMNRARYSLAIAALDRLDAEAQAHDAPAESIDRLRRELNQQCELAKRRMAEPVAADAPRNGFLLRRRLLELQADELARLRAAGELGHEAYGRLQRELDLEHARLRAPHR